MGSARGADREASLRGASMVYTRLCAGHCALP